MRDSQSGDRPSKKIESGAIGGEQYDDRPRSTGGETADNEGQSCGIAGQTRNPHEMSLIYQPELPGRRTRQLCTVVTFAGLCLGNLAGW